MSMRLMYGAPPKPRSKRANLLDGLEELAGPPRVDPPPSHAEEEVGAFTGILELLKPLTPEQRKRVMRSVYSWFGVTP